jgi:predicted MPP superfamily phosphohydrolase
MPKTQLSRRDFLKLSGRLIGGLAVTGALGYGYVHIEPKWVDYNQFSLEIPNLPPAFDGYKIAHFTDTHFDEHITPQYFEKIVKKINTFQPDLIAFTGDLIDGRTPKDYDSSISNILDELQATDLVCGVSGNHDHWSGINRFNKILENGRMVILANAVQRIQRGDQSLYICGTDSHMEGKSNIGAVTAALPEDCCAILLAHEPDFADISSATGKFALQLSGHTHGGLVHIPFYGPPVGPQHGVKYTSGLYLVNQMVVYTNHGIGTGKYYFRFNCRPEVAIITLNRKPSDD